MSDEVELKRNSYIDESLEPVTITRNVYSVFPSFAMLAGMQLDVFTPLKDGPMSARSLAEALGVREDKLSPLLYLLVAAGLMKVENGVFSNEEEANKFLVKGCPDYMGALSGFYKLIWEVSLKTADSIRTGKPQAKLDFYNLPDEELLAYFQKQVHSSLKGGQEIADKLDLSKFENMLDAGGGSGGTSIAICAKYQNLKATMLDLPKVAGIAKGFIEKAGMADRIDTSAADLCADPLTGRYDLAILRAVIQTLSKKEAVVALKNVSQSIAPEGTIYIIGNVMKNSRLGPPVSMAFSLVFLNSYDDGNAYTEEEYHEMMTMAGFKDITFDYEIFDGQCLVSAVK